MKENEGPVEITLDLIRYLHETERRTVNFLGYGFVVDKGVFPLGSPYSYSSMITAKYLNPNKGDVVLDIGTGTGVQSVISAKRGASKVVAVDIDGRAVNNARENSALHNLDYVIDTRKSDIFDEIDNDERFDLIISQLPLVDAEHESEFSHMLFDPGYALHERCLEQARHYMKPDATLLMTGGDLADEDKFKELFDKYDYQIDGWVSELFRDVIWKVYSLKVRR